MPYATMGRRRGLRFSLGVFFCSGFLFWSHISGRKGLRRVFNVILILQNIVVEARGHELDGYGAARLSRRP